MYNPAKGVFFGKTQFLMSNSAYDLKNDSTNASTKYETKTQKLEQALEFGVNKSLVALFNLGYTLSSETEFDTSKEKSSGIDNVSLGARYRLSNAIKMPMVLDVSAVFTPSYKNKKDANVNDDGTTNSGGHDLSLSARTSFNKFYLRGHFDYHFEQKVDDATSGDAHSTVKSSMDMGLKLGAQLYPLTKLLIDTSVAVDRVGEAKTEYEAGGDLTAKARLDFKLQVEAYYEIMSQLSANLGFQYISPQNQTLEGTTDYIVENNSETGIIAGLAYKF